MELGIHQKLSEKIRDEQRDVALITAPGMGLSSLLMQLRESSDVPVTWLDTKTIIHYWETEFKDRARGRWFVLHAAIISGLIESEVIPADSSVEELFKTNLNEYLCNAGYGPDNAISTLVVIDDFDELPDDLALVVCKEMKALADVRSQKQYGALKGIRFVIGGALDFSRLFAGQTRSGVSPATNFWKCQPHDFLLRSQESALLLEEMFPQLSKLSPSIGQLIVDWTAGYLHYLVEFARWILQEGRGNLNVSVSGLVARLKEAVEEHDPLVLYRYCESSWNFVESDESLMPLLISAVSAGYVADLSGNGRELAGLGLLAQNPAVRSVFYPTNKLVEVFVRQRLAERGMVLPIADGAIWAIPSLNVRAYELVLEIENRLRNFIGDCLFSRYGDEWKDRGLQDLRSADGTAVLEKTLERMQQEQKSIYAASDLADPFLTYLEFGDLRAIVEKNRDLFPTAVAQKLSPFLDELTYHRRRIAHSRPMTSRQIEDLARRWEIIQRMMTGR